MWGASARPMLLWLAGVCLTACVHVGQQQREPWRFFTLSPLPEAEQAKTSSSSPGPVQLAIGVGPIHLPGYLDQDQIVTRISQNRWTLSDNARWAEPLADNTAQVLAHNLSILLRTDRVRLHPWPGQQRPTYQLEIDLLSFETDTAGTAHLVARWFLRDVASRQTIAEKQTRLTTSAAGTSTEQSVASLSKALGDFSVAVANVIRKLVHPHTTQSSVGAGDRTSPPAAVISSWPGGARGSMGSRESTSAGDAKMSAGSLADFSARSDTVLAHSAGR